MRTLEIEESTGRVRCPLCGRFVHTYVPSRGDGSGRYFRPHRCADGEIARRVDVPGFECSRIDHSPIEVRKV